MNNEQIQPGQYGGRHLRTVEVPAGVASNGAATESLTSVSGKSHIAAGYRGYAQPASTPVKNSGVSAQQIPKVLPAVQYMVLGYPQRPQ